MKGNIDFYIHAYVCDPGLQNGEYLPPKLSNICITTLRHVVEYHLCPEQHDKVKHTIDNEINTNFNDSLPL